MHNFLLNLIIGIIGGVYSGVIVSRVFLIREELEEQLDVLRNTSYGFGTLMAFFDVVESILKLSSDTSDEIEQEINKDPNYLKTHDIIRVSDLIKTLKKEILDKSVDMICESRNELILKDEKFKDLHNETTALIRGYKELKEFKFHNIDNCKKEIQVLENKYEKCFAEQNKFFMKRILHDKVLAIMGIAFVALCICIAL